jgi:catechol 2,3-dioxygenase-like lactoylglutathione lyase family enzyme
MGAMDVLSSRVLLRPTDPERSRVFYRDTLGLAIYREFGGGPDRGTVFFLGGGFLELSGRAAEPPAPGMALWLMGDQGPLCGLPWPVCPDDLGQRLGSRAGTAWCPGCGRRWPAG